MTGPTKPPPGYQRPPTESQFDLPPWVERVYRDIGELRVGQAKVDTSLSLGNAAFAELRARVHTPIWGVVLGVASLVWTVGYSMTDKKERATRDEVEQVRAAVDSCKAGTKDLEVRLARTEQLAEELERGIRRTEEAQRGLASTVAGLGRRK